MKLTKKGVKGKTKSNLIFTKVFFLAPLVETRYSDEYCFLVKYEFSGKIHPLSGGCHFALYSRSIENDITIPTTLCESGIWNQQLIWTELQHFAIPTCPFVNLLYSERLQALPMQPIPCPWIIRHFNRTPVTFENNWEGVGGLFSLRLPPVNSPQTEKECWTAFGKRQIHFHSIPAAAAAAAVAPVSTTP